MTQFEGHCSHLTVSAPQECQNFFSYANSLVSLTLKNIVFSDVTPCILVDIYKVSEESTDPTFHTEDEGNIPVEWVHRGIRESMNPSKWGISGTSVYILLILTSVTIFPDYKKIKVSTNTPIFFQETYTFLKAQFLYLHFWKVKI